MAEKFTDYDLDVNNYRINDYVNPSGNRTNDLRIALKFLGNVRLLVNKLSDDYCPPEGLHPLTPELDKWYDILESEMLDHSGLTGDFVRQRLVRQRAGEPMEQKSQPVSEEIEHPMDGKLQSPQPEND
tara:strand:- start:430 stop:813 length:384 start_codon:yes stop_codon:yes gene_type:complete